MEENMPLVQRRKKIHPSTVRLMWWLWAMVAILVVLMLWWAFGSLSINASSPKKPSPSASTVDTTTRPQ